MGECIEKALFLFLKRWFLFLEETAVFLLDDEGGGRKDVPKPFRVLKAVACPAFVWSVVVAYPRWLSASKSSWVAVKVAAGGSDSRLLLDGSRQSETLAVASHVESRGLRAFAAGLPVMAGFEGAAPVFLLFGEGWCRRRRELQGHFSLLLAGVCPCGG